MIKMYDDPSDRGISNFDISQYLATIFDTYMTTRRYHDKGPLDLKEGYATMVSVDYVTNDINQATLFIVYKYKGIVYYYDTTTNTNTVSIDKILKRFKTKRFESYTYFYTNSSGAELNKNKLVSPIHY
jgi:hypothetical protein